MNGRKVLLLGILLLLPVLAFLFLQTFGHNAYKLRTYLPEQVAPARAGAQAVSGDTVFHRVDDAVKLTAATGQPFSPARELRGRVVVLGIGRDGVTGNTARPALRGMARVQERYQAKPAVKLLTIVPAPSLDLAALAERSGAISGKWTFASAAPTTIQHLRAELRDSAALANPAAPPQLWLLDGDRYLRGIYDPADPREIDRLLTEVGVLLRIESNPPRR